MPRVTVSNGEMTIAADVQGPTDLGTVLFLHAGGETRSVWEPITGAVSAQGWRTVAVDLRGHGESGRAPRYALDDFIADAVRVHGELCTGPVVIVGGSIGGAIGLLLAGEGHAPVAALVLLDTSTRPRPAIAMGERNRLVAAQSRGAPALASVDPAFLHGPFAADVTADLDRWRLAAHRVHVPAMLIAGAHSAALGAQEIETTRQDLPQIEVVTVAAGHLVARDCPHDVAAHLKRFLAARHWPA